MTKYSGFGTLLKIGDGGGPEVFTTIAHVRNISGPGFSFDMIDVTSHDSPGAYEEMVPSIIRTEELTLDIIYDPAHATHNAATGLLNKVANRAKTNFQIVFPDTALTTWTFAAYVNKFTPTTPFDDALTAQVNLKPTGQPTIV